jgi:hypothetical protein
MLIFNGNAVINLENVTDFYRCVWFQKISIRFFFNFLDSTEEQSFASWIYSSEEIRDIDYFKIIAAYKSGEKVCQL